jgi:hypothetical protein
VSFLNEIIEKLIMFTDRIEIIPDNDNKPLKTVTKQEVFLIKKEKKSYISSNENTLNFSNEDKTFTSTIDKEDISDFIKFIEVSQNDTRFKPSLYLTDNDTNMLIDQEEKSLTQSSNLEEYSGLIVDPKFDPSSNWNFFRRRFIPAISKSKERIKDKVPFLKDFNPKFLKKENIDKKILRKFRNYVRAVYKESGIFFAKFDMGFWKNFSERNLLPPMIYRDNGAEIQFKSFNVNYMVWLFSKCGAVELYSYFVVKQGNELLNSFVDEYGLNDTIEEGVVEKLKYYIDNMHEMFNGKLTKMDSCCSEFNHSLTTQLQSEEILEHYLGDYKEEHNNAFRLNYFDTIVYPRCGMKVVDENENGFNFDMNCSMDSILSAE